MKLRNKKTGEIIIPSDYTFATYDDGIKYGHHIYCSLAELNEEWEDYKPAEPLIKDEKIRKAVREWAWANKLEAEYVVKYYFNSCSLNSWQVDIEFNTHIEGLKDGEDYTIAELCGEEEE
jgi:hypothetical protein